MTEPTETEIAGSLAGQRTVVDHLVAFLKAASIYPENNRRVLNSADDLIDRVQAGDSFVVHVVGEEIRVNGEATELPELLNDWFRDAFYKSNLAGVEIHPGLTREALALFAARLQESGRKDDPDFVAEWPEDQTGLVPLNLMFRGYHRAGPGGAESDADTTETLFGGGPMLTEPLAPDSAQNQVAALLAADESVKERMNALRDRWDADLGPDAEMARVDLVSEIARLLPAEAMRNEARARELIHRILDSLGEYRPGDKADSGSVAAAESTDLHGAALNVARRFFDHRIPVHDITHRDELPAGRPGDEVVTENLPALLEEYADLPDAAGITFPVDDESLDAELLGIFLHRLVSEEGSDQEERLTELMGGLLVDLTDQKIRVLSSYLEPCVTGDAHAAKQRPEWRILEILRELGRLGVLRRAGLLDATLAAALFPEMFGLFLDTLSPDDEEDRGRLRRAVGMIGTDRIREATPELTGEKRILSSSRIRMVLASESLEVVPLIGVFTENSDAETRREIALLLRKLEPPLPESAALRAVDPPDLLPAGYLRDLCQVDWTEPNAKLREYSRFLLTKYINDTAGDANLAQRRVYAIRSLAHLPGPETAAFLGELATKGRLLKMTKAARAVRTAATRTLEEIGNV